MISAGREARARANGDPGQQLSQSIDRALAILETFWALQPEAGVQEIAAKLNLTPSTVSRLLATLESRGYVQQDARTGRFRLGLSTLELGYRFAATDDLFVKAVPHIDAVAQRLTLNAHLYGLDRGQLIRYLSVANPPGQTLTGGFRFHPHSTASGKLLLASLDDETLEHLLPTLDLPAATPRTITNLAALQREIATIRERGHGTDDEEARLGNACLAVPVRDATGTVIAALSVSGPVSRFAAEHRSPILECLFERAYQLSQALGHVSSQVV
jgi:IclR family transcriptional regulator, KDG regulon repressor